MCKNFQEIHSELLEVVYSYMQTIQFENLNIKFILITEDLSFIPDNIINNCNIIQLERPSKSNYIKNFKNKNIKDIKDINSISNIKNLKSQIQHIEPDKIICDTIIKELLNFEKLDYIYFRELLYDVFIYNINLFESVWYILYSLVKLNKINEKNINNILEKTYKFFQYYNNNYRPIYHLESYLLYLIIEINELSDSS